jgi:polysaccharide biosynthesis transport protein
MVSVNAPEALQVSDLGAIVKRRKVHILVPFLLVLMAAAAIAYSLPAVYRSTGTIAIERQDIAPDLATSGVTGYVDERLQSITHRIMQASTLLSLAEEIGIYDPDDEQGVPPHEIVSLLRDNTVFEPIRGDVANPRTGRTVPLVVAFSVSFDSHDPELARRVAERLVELYLDESARQRREQAAAASGFLAAEADRLRSTVADLEGRLAAFKKENVGRLPELNQFNLQRLERTEAMIRQSQTTIESLDERLIALRAQLGQTEAYAHVYDLGGNRVPSEEQRLQFLRAEYARLSALYAPDHPDIARLRRELSAHEQGSGVDATPRLREELEATRAQLAAARERYAAEHPDVVRLARSVAALEERVRREPQRSDGGGARAPSNPAYISLQTQISAAEANLRAERDRLEQLRAALTSYEALLLQAPEVEQEYLTLTRDYDNALRRYREVTDRQMAAQLGEHIEVEQKAERYVLVGAPRTPSAPIKPNRPGIFFVGVVLALGAGVGMASLAEYFDRSVRDARSLRTALDVPVLATVPKIPEPRAGHPGRRWVVVLVVLVLVTTGVVLLHEGLPVDQLQPSPSNEG